MERVLLTGVDSMIGSNIALALADRCQLLGLYEHLPVRSAMVQTAAWDPDCPTSLSGHLETWQPRWLVHCGPLAASSWESAPTAQEGLREPAIVGRMAELAATHGCALTVLSSDAVFCGPRMFQDERCQALAASPQAVQGRAVERALEGSSALIVRSCVYGWNLAGGSPSFAQRACQSLRRGRMPESDGRRYATPILASDLAGLLWRAHQAELRGLYHISGAERTSMHRFVCELAASLSIDTVEPDLAPHEAATAEETSLSSKRVRRTLSVSTPMLREGLERFAAQIDSGLLDAWTCDSAASLREIAA